MKLDDSTMTSLKSPLPEYVWTLRAGLQEDDEAAPPAGLGEEVAVELLAGSEVSPGRAGVQPSQRLVVREHELSSSTGAGHPHTGLGGHQSGNTSQMTDT